MIPPKPDTDDATKSNSGSKQAGFLSVAKVMFSGLIMIGKKETWETNGIGAEMTPRQIVLGALTGAVALAVLLFVVVRIAIRLATS